MNRKEAIEIVRKNYPHVGFSGSEFETALRELVPEFKEQPDPRHSLIEFIKWSCDRGSITPEQRENVDFWLAYLERQKKQTTKTDACGFPIRDKGESACSYLERCLAPDMRNIWYEACAEIKERQKEQKPAEWSEFDKGALKDAICAADRLGNDESFKKSNPNLAKAFRVAKDWLKSLPERFTLQPEQEVVDRTVFDRIADILRWCDLPIGCPIEDFKQSESEREHLLHIVQCVAHRYANSCTYCKEYSRGYQDGLAVPHWKPSEKQINALQAFVGMIHPDARYDAVFGLLEELKAL